MSLNSSHGKYSSLTCNVLSEIRNSGEYSDVIIRTDDQYLFKVHRAILCSCSSFFHALFTNGMNETTDRIVDIHNINGDMMNLILDYIYTNEIKLNESNIYEILSASNQLQILELMLLCEDYLIEKLNSENILGIKEFASFFFCKKLFHQAEIYLLTNFTEISQKSEEFLELNVEQLKFLLNSDELNVKSEEANIVDLLKCVRLGLLTTNFFIEKVKSHPYINHNQACKPLVIETLKYLYKLDLDTSQDLIVPNPIARPRIPHEILFVCGGWSGGSPTAAMELYDTRADKWIQLSFNDRFPRAYHGIVTINELIYIIGGFDGMEYFNSCRMFNIQTFQWNEIAPMNVKRCYVSVVVSDGLIYAMGGFDGHLRQNTAERYSPATNQWLSIPSMHVQRSAIQDASATILQDKIYICGGFNGQECMNSAEYFDPKTNQWTIIAPMRSKRSGIGVIAYHNSIYALGGFNGSTRLNSGEKYNPKTNTWISIPDMYNPRSNFAIEICDDYLFVIGGFNGITTIFNVECFDDNTNEWYDAADMNVFRSALSACVLKGFDNIHNLITYTRKQVLSIPTLSSIIPVGTLSSAVGALTATIDNITS